MIFLFSIFLLFILASLLFLRAPQFGRLPSGKRLELIKKSRNYRNGKFQNISPTPALTEGSTYATVIRKFIFGKSKRGIPAEKVPSKKCDLLQLGAAENVLIWFGHSSYFLQLNGNKILVDPVFSGSASPVKFTTRSFKGTDVYTTDDLPIIDYLFLSHDHYDHLDSETIVALKPKVKKVITGLGVGAHLERWGYDAGNIIEKDWDETEILDENLVIHTVPARHFSGRGFKRNNSLWLSFVLIMPTQKIFIGGDSGYDQHFKLIGEKFGPFDLVILENGQYNEQWRYIHMMPEEVVQAAVDLKAKVLLPVHWGKFSLSLHAWDEPIKRLTSAAKNRDILIVHPIIGEPLYLKNPTSSTAWWEGVS